MTTNNRKETLSYYVVRRGEQYTNQTSGTSSSCNGTEKVYPDPLRYKKQYRVGVLSRKSATKRYSFVKLG